MYRLNYRMNGTIESKLFDTIEEAYWFAVDNLATDEDREWYYNLCGETFESVVVNLTVDKDTLFIGLTTTFTLCPQSLQVRSILPLLFVVAWVITFPVYMC